MSSTLPNRSGPAPLSCRTGVLLLLLLTAAASPASAQVSLQLQHRVEGPGQGLIEGIPLPPQTTVVVIRHSADRAHTLKNAGVSRKELTHRVLTRLRRRDTTFRLVSDGRTPRRYARTAQSGEILYVLARTPADSLYESYVNTGERFVPGFDAVQSGRMTMGPAPPEAQRRYRAVFRLRREMRADSDADATPKTTSIPGTESASGDSESGGPDAREADSQVEEPASSGSSRELSVGFVWWLLLGGVAGSLAGGGMVWSLLSDRLRRTEEARNELHNELQDLKGQQFEETPETDPPATAGSVEELTTVSPSPDELRELRGEVERLCEEIEQLRDENKRLREKHDRLHEENGKLQDEIEHLREESDRLHDENEQLHEENRRLQEELHGEDEDVEQQIEKIRKHLQRLQGSADGE
ncbi:MAG: hypothetical protein ABEL04_03575 [Salinibacter sp.]|uniref:hypothetical protein n=1 Tax=Salinibacter sp. TaxID=2065818 RepID=UPI0035D402CA